jgi:hypothetical protein
LNPIPHYCNQIMLINILWPNEVGIYCNWLTNKFCSSMTKLLTSFLLGLISTRISIKSSYPVWSNTVVLRLSGIIGGYLKFVRTRTHLRALYSFLNLQFFDFISIFKYSLFHSDFLFSLYPNTVHESGFGTKRRYFRLENSATFL